MTIIRVLVWKYGTTLNSICLFTFGVFSWCIFFIGIVRLQKRFLLLSSMSPNIRLNDFHLFLDKLFPQRVLKKSLQCIIASSIIVSGLFGPGFWSKEVITGWTLRRFFGYINGFQQFTTLASSMLTWRHIDADLKEGRNLKNWFLIIDTQRNENPDFWDPCVEFDVKIKFNTKLELYSIFFYH